MLTGRGRSCEGFAGLQVRPIDSGWEVAPCEPTGDEDPPDLDGLRWLPAVVPGTVAGALAAAGKPIDDLDGRDWWFRTTFDSEPPADGEDIFLSLGGIATLADVFLNGQRLLRSESMFRRHVVDVGTILRGENVLLIRCRALSPELARQRRPRPRWRTRLVADNNLRWFRTMLLGRVPGFAPGPPAVGPWRPVTLERCQGVVVEGLRVRSRLEGRSGVVSISVDLRAIGPEVATVVEAVVEGPGGRRA
jgi:beta-mannosidase